MSNIGDYQALVAAISVSFTSQAGWSIALTAKDATELKINYDNPDTPVRLLLPYGGGENMSAELMEPDATFGTNVSIRWTFSDVMLWRHVTFGEGLKDSAYDLREYTTAYMTAAYAMEQPGITDRLTLESIRVQVREALNFPEGSANLFIGAVATWSVVEDDPP